MMNRQQFILFGQYLRELPQNLALLLLTLYKYTLSPLLGNNCRYYPTCSSYAQTAIVRFGVTKGAWLTVKRLLRCHPWHEGGDDPVPEK